MNNISLVNFDFHELVDTLVDFERKNRGCSLRDIAAMLDLDEGYVRKLNAPSVKRHYTFEQLYIISRKWDVDINVFLPSPETLRQLTAFKDFTDDQIIRFINDMISNLKGIN